RDDSLDDGVAEEHDAGYDDHEGDGIYRFDAAGHLRQHLAGGGRHHRKYEYENRDVTYFEKYPESAEVHPTKAAIVEGPMLSCQLERNHGAQAEINSCQSHADQGGARPTAQEELHQFAPC